MMLTKADRARMLRRCRRPALASMEYGSIVSELMEISSKCEDIHYFCDGDGRTLLDALDGDEEAEYEFQMAFAALDEKVNALSEAIERQNWEGLYDEDFDLAADFNACLVALVGDFYRQRGDSIWGYDAGEGDFFELDKYDEEYAVSEAGKRLCRRTKQDMVTAIQRTLRIFLAMLDIREEYDYLRSAFDLLKDENMALLRTVKDIEDAYETAERKSQGFTLTHCPEIRAFDRLVATLPQRCWVE